MPATPLRRVFLVFFALGAGLCLMLAASVFLPVKRGPSNKPNPAAGSLRRTALALMALLLGVQSFLFAARYRSTDGFYQALLERQPHNPAAWTNYGWHKLYIDGDPEAAEAILPGGIQAVEASRNESAKVDAMHNLLVLCLEERPPVGSGNDAAVHHEPLGCQPRGQHLLLARCPAPGAVARVRQDLQFVPFGYSPLTIESFPLIFPYVMKVYYDLKEYGESLPYPVVTLGNFDGIHRGHQEIFRVLLKEAKENHGTALVITFFPHPLKVLHPERAPRLITNIRDRVELMECCGIDRVLCLPFDQEFAAWEAERFVREILVEKIGIKEVLVGEDFRFGKNREGGINFLRKQGEPFGFTVRRIEPVQVDGLEISSTRIRQSIQEGLIRESTAMLGRPYNISGTVVTGDKRGRTLGYPTANLATKAELLPPNGVYAVRAVLGEERWPGVASLGIKPTFAGKQYSIETHILDFDRDIYGRFMRMEFVERIREERSFPDANALMDQIGRDAEQARKILEQAPFETRLRSDEHKAGSLS